jgi:hypothetical protein
MQVGEKYYFMVHAYHHFIAEVLEVLGPKRIKAGRCVRVQSCGRDWTEFFKEGIKKEDTKYTVWPSGKIFEFFDATPWHHDIPTE